MSQTPIRETAVAEEHAQVAERLRSNRTLPGPASMCPEAALGDLLFQAFTSLSIAMGLPLGPWKGPHESQERLLDLIDRVALLRAERDRLRAERGPR